MATHDWTTCAYYQALGEIQCVETTTQCLPKVLVVLSPHETMTIMAVVLCMAHVLANERLPHGQSHAASRASMLAVVSNVYNWDCWIKNDP